MVLAAMPQLASKVHSIHWQVRTGDMLAWYTPIRKVFAEREVLRQCLGGNESTGTRICLK